MFESDAFVGCSDFDRACRASGSRLEPVGDAEQLSSRDLLGESVVCTHLATDNGHPDVPMHADDPIRWIGPKCALRVDLELAALLPSQAHPAMVGRRWWRLAGLGQVATCACRASSVLRGRRRHQAARPLFAKGQG